MQTFKKALALVLTLALILTCIPVLAGSVSAAAVPNGAVFTNLQAANVDPDITLHGVEYQAYDNKDTAYDKGENGNPLTEVYMYGRVDNTNAKLFGYKDDFYATSSPAYGGNAYWHLRESAGGRIRFATNSNYIAIEATLFHRNANYASDMEAAKYGFDVYADTVDGSVYVGTIRANKPTSAPTTVTVLGALDLTSAPTDANGNYSLTIYFPITIETREVSLGIAQDAEYLAHSVAYSSTAPIVYYGSSITQGGIVKYPGDAYTAIVGRMLNADYINLGTWGSCYGYEVSAPYVAGLDMSVFVMDYDHNESVATNSDPDDNNSLAEKHYDFYQIIREKNPYIPIIMITRPNNSPVSKDKYGNVITTSADMKAVILESYNRAITENKDQNVHFIDGEAFFNYDGGVISANGTYTKDGVYLSDNVHPNTTGQAAMADVVASVIRLANAGYKNIYVDKDEISFGGNKEDIIFDSTDAVDPMTSANWTSGTVSGKTLALAAGQNATLQGIDNLDKLSGYTAVAALNIAQSASATVTIGGKTVTVSANGTVTSDANTGSFTPVPNANGSVDVVLGITCINNGFNVYINSDLMFHAENGVMGGAPSFGAVNGAVTVQSLMITAPTQRIEYYATLDSEITMNFKMHLVDDVAEGAYAKFECQGKESDKIDYVKQGDAYIFSYGVAAKNMADDISLNIYNSNGQMIAQHTTSVKNYADIIINGNYNNRFQKIAKALLNYGAAMQIYKGYNTSDLANNSFAENWDAEAIGADLSKYAPTASSGDTLPEGVQFHGTSLLLESKTVIRHYFIMDAETAANYSDTLERLNETTFYYKDIEVDASNLDLMESFTLGNFTIRYSALSYAYLILNAEPNVYSESMVDLAKALYLYSISTEVIETEDNEFEVLPF